MLCRRAALRGVNPGRGRQNQSVRGSPSSRRCTCSKRKRDRHKYRSRAAPGSGERRDRHRRTPRHRGTRSRGKGSRRSGRRTRRAARACSACSRHNPAGHDGARGGGRDNRRPSLRVGSRGGLLRKVRHLPPQCLNRLEEGRIERGRYLVSQILELAKSPPGRGGRGVPSFSWRAALADDGSGSASASRRGVAGGHRAPGGEPVPPPRRALAMPPVAIPRPRCLRGGE